MKCQHALAIAHGYDRERGEHIGYPNQLPRKTLATTRPAKVSEQITVSGTNHQVNVRTRRTSPPAPRVPAGFVMRHMKPQTSTMLPVIPCSRLTFLRCADPRKLQHPIPKDIRAGGFSSRTESNKQLCPGTHRPAIRGINSRSRAHFPRQPRDFTAATKTVPETKCVKSKTYRAFQRTWPGLVVERNIQQHRALARLMNDVRPEPRSHPL